MKNKKTHFAIIDEYHQHPPLKIVKKPICTNCKKVCSPAGGIVGEVTTLWKCFDCGFEVEDIAVLITPLNNQ